MKHIVKVLIFLLAVAIFALVLLVFWFIFANFTYRYGFSGTISYMLHTMDSWWQGGCAFFRDCFDRLRLKGNEVGICGTTYWQHFLCIRS